MNHPLSAPLSACLALLLGAPLATAHAEGPGPEAKALIQAAMDAAPAVGPVELQQRLEAGDTVLIDVRQESEIEILGRILPQGEQHGDPARLHRDQDLCGDR